MRSRARYEVHNNSYARGIVDTLANDTIGTGPRLQLTGLAGGTGNIVERRFAEWADAIGLASKLCQMRRERVISGESFAMFALNSAVRVGPKLDLRIYEADQIATPTPSFDDPNATDGIVFDEFGNPIVYHVLKRHPGDMGGAFSAEKVDVPARNMIHYYREDRPGQRRGVPEIAPALDLFAQLRRYRSAAVLAAETSASFPLVFETSINADGDEEGGDAIPGTTFELERNVATFAPRGYRLSHPKPEHPTTTFGEFTDKILNEIARCLNMPFNIAAGNSSGYNYASGRLDHQTYFRAVRVEQRNIERTILDRIFSEWLDLAVLIEDYLPRDARVVNVDMTHEWFWDGFEHVDPMKEARAQAQRLASGTTTLADEYAREGRDWEVKLRQRGRELALMRELGISPEGVSVRDGVVDEDEED